MEAPGQARQRFDWAYALALTVLLSGFFAERATQGCEYPTPWPDEGSFLWQAINFAEHGTLFAPELNPTRHILWMPPAYMVLTGAIFSVVGFSLPFARLLSAIFIAGAVLGVAYMLRRSRLRLAHVAIWALFLTSPIFQLAANTARMEPLVLLLATLAFALMSRGATWAGMAVACLSPLAHPNGVFPAGGALVLAGATRALEGRWPKVQRRDYGAFALLAAAWTTYAVYVLLHLDQWLVDISEQLDWKNAESALTGGFGERISHIETPLLAVLCALLAWGAVRIGRMAQRSSSEVASPVAFKTNCAVIGLAGSFAAQTLVTVGWMYEVYAAFAFALVANVALELGAEFVRQRRPERFALVASGLVVAALAFAFTIPRRPFLMRSVLSAVVFRRDAPKYVTDEDVNVVRGALTQLARWHGPLTIQFLPEADALLFADLRSERIKFLQQTRYDGVADMYVFHDSVWVPEVVRRMNVLRVAFRQGVPIPIPKWPVIHHRNGSEQWRVYRR